MPKSPEHKEILYRSVLSRTKVINVDGLTHTMEEICRSSGIDRHLLRKWVKKGFTHQEVVDRFRYFHGKIPHEGLFPTESSVTRNRHPQRKLITVDGLTADIPSTCARLGLHLSTFRKWINRGIREQQVADAMRFTPRDRYGSVFPEFSKSLKLTNGAKIDVLH